MFSKFLWLETKSDNWFILLITWRQENQLNIKMTHFIFCLFVLHLNFLSIGSSLIFFNDHLFIMGLKEEKLGSVCLSKTFFAPSSWFNGQYGIGCVSNLDDFHLSYEQINCFLWIFKGYFKLGAYCVFILLQPELKNI